MSRILVMAPNRSQAVLDKIVTAFLSQTPEAPPDDYAHRKREVELGSRLEAHGG